MKTCKVGCGKMKAGGPVKKVKKMAKGGAADYNYGIPLNGLPMRPTNGNTDISKNQMGTNPTMKKGGMVKNLNKDGEITKADILKGRGVFKKGGTKKYQGGGNTGENPNPSGKSIGKQAGVFGGALAALVGLTREEGIQRRAQKAEERYKKRQEKKQAKVEAKNMPKSRMGGMTKSKKK